MTIDLIEKYKKVFEVKWRNLLGEIVIEQAIQDTMKEWKQGIFEEYTTRLIQSVGEELIGDGTPQILRKSKLKEDIAWCNGRNKLREEQRSRLAEIINQIKKG